MPPIQFQWQAMSYVAFGVIMAILFVSALLYLIFRLFVFRFEVNAWSKTATKLSHDGLACKERILINTLEVKISGNRYSFSNNFYLVDDADFLYVVPRYGFSGVLQLPKSKLRRERICANFFTLTSIAPNDATVLISMYQWNSVEQFIRKHCPHLDLDPW